MNLKNFNWKTTVGGLGGALAIITIVYGLITGTTEWNDATAAALMAAIGAVWTAINSRDADKTVTAAGKTVPVPTAK